MKEKYMTPEQRKAARRLDAIYDRQGAIQKKMAALVSESGKLMKENEKLLRQLGWW